MKRIGFLFALILTSICSLAQNVKVENIAYEIDPTTKTAIIAENCIVPPDGETYGVLSGEIKIPKHISYEGTKYKVTGIEEGAFFNCRDITAIEIPNTVTTITGRAFFGCSGLTNFEIPKSVTSIGEGAFSECSGLTSIVIPKSVTSISDYAFSQCSSLSSVTISNSVTSIGDDVFYGCDNLTSVTIPKSVIQLSTEAFRNSGVKTLTVHEGNPNYCAVDNVLFNKAMTELLSCITLKEGAYTVPNTVKKIADNAFKDCSGITSVVVPNSVDSIGASAFDSCDRLVSISLPASLVSIGEDAFSDCTSLKTIPLPATLKHLGGGAFKRCSGLTSVELPASLSKITNSLFFECTNLTSVVIPGSVTEIHSHAFGNNTRLASIAIPCSVASIETDAFEGCSALRKVEIDAPKMLVQRLTNEKLVSSIFGNQVEEYVIGNSVENIGSHAFSGCEALRTVTLPNSLKVLKDNTFSGCKHLVSIAIPASVTGIGEETFMDCKDLSSVEFPASLTSIGARAFSGCKSLAEVALPASLKSIAPSTFDGCTRLAEVALPASLTSIGANAFKDCSALRTVTVPQSVTTLEAGAFSGCKSLTSIELPASATSIADRLFDHCTHLTTVTIPASVTKIGRSAFEECRSLATVTIPASVTSIDDDAFRGCNSLSALDIPSTVMHIGTMAFPHHIYKNSATVINRNFYGLTLGVTTKQEAIKTLLDQRVKLVVNTKDCISGKDVTIDGCDFKNVYFHFYNGVFNQISFGDGDISSTGEEKASRLSSSKRNTLSKNYTQKYGAYKYYFFESEDGMFSDDVTRLLITENALIFADEALSEAKQKDDDARFRAIRPFASTRISKTVLDCTLGASTKDEVIAALSTLGASVVQEAYPDSVVFSGVSCEGVQFDKVTAKFFAGKLFALDFANAGKGLSSSDFQTLKSTFQSRYAAYDMSIGLSNVSDDTASYFDDAVTVGISRQNGLFFQDAKLSKQYADSFMASLRGRREIDPDKQFYVDLFRAAMGEDNK